MKRLIVGLLIAIVVFACKDEDSSPTKTQLLTGKAWRLTSIEVNGDEQPLPSCFGDDEIYFYTDGLFEWVYKEDLCNEDGPLYYDGEWEFNEDQTEIMWEISGGSESDFEIIELTSSVFRLRLIDDVDQVLTLEVVEE